MLDENISWMEHIGTVETKLAKKIGLLYHAKPLLKEKSLKFIYFAYIHSYLNYANINKAPLTFNELIKKPFHKYLTKFSKNCFSLIAISLKSTKYCISFRGLKIWNNFLTKEEKELQSFSIFKKVVHSKLLKGEHELEYF